MTLPALINDKQNKELEAGLKQAYSILQNSYNQMGYDEGQIINHENYKSWDFINSFKKYFKTRYTCADMKCATIKTNHYRTYNNKHMEESYLDDGQMQLTNGMFVMIENPYNGGKLYITIDINGINKRPNKWGHDLFTFQVTNNGKLLPMGAKGSDYAPEEYCSDLNNTIYNGIACTYRALTEKDYLKIYQNNYLLEIIFKFCG